MMLKNIAQIFAKETKKILVIMVCVLMV